jgi:hypothetical protein
MNQRQPYLSFLLRIWLSGEGDTQWRASLEDTRSGARYGFATLADAFAFLEAQRPAPHSQRPHEPPAGAPGLEQG